MLRQALLLLFMFMLLLVVGQSLNASSELQFQIKTHNGKSVDFVPGDVAHLVVQVWPVAEREMQKFVSLVDQNEIDSIYVTEVLSSSFSVNNQEVLEINVVAIILGSRKDGAPETVLVNGRNVDVIYQKIKMNIQGLVKEKDFYILEQSVQNEFRPSMVVIILLIILIGLLLVVLCKLLIKRKTQKRELKMQELLFETAKNILFVERQRGSIEQVYLQKECWIPYLKDDQDANELLKCIEEVLYVREWSESATALLSEKCHHLGKQLERV